MNEGGVGLLDTIVASKFPEGTRLGLWGMKRDDFETSPSLSGLFEGVFSPEVKLFMDTSCNVERKPLGKRRAEACDFCSVFIVSFDCSLIFEKSSSKAPDDTELQPVVNVIAENLDELVDFDLVDPFFDIDAEWEENLSRTDFEATVHGETRSGCNTSISKL